MRWELRQGCYRATIERHDAGYIALLWDQRTDAGRRGIATARSGPLPSQHAARAWVYRQIDATAPLTFPARPDFPENPAVSP